MINKSKEIQCTHCDKKFTTKTSMYRHRKYACTGKHVVDNTVQILDNIKDVIVKPNKQFTMTNQTNQTALENMLKNFIDKQKEWNAGIDAKFESLAVKSPKTQIFNIEKIQIFMTDPVDFVDLLTKRFGSRKQAVDHIKSKIHQKVDGDVSLFCDIYLSGEPDTWPISCLDKKNHIYRIAQPNAEPINDPGGVEMHRIFRNSYSNTLLRLNNAEIYETIAKSGTSEFENYRDNLLDSFELGMIQEKAYSLCRAPCEHFIKKLSTKLKMIERSFELAKIM